MKKAICIILTAAVAAFFVFNRARPRGRREAQ